MAMGVPLFESMMTFTTGSGATASFAALWSPKGTVIPEFSAEEFSVLEDKVGDSGMMSAIITLKDDPSVQADISFDSKLGFVPVGDALANWVRKTYPDDCAYLDEVEYPATVYWVQPDKSVLRMPAKWLNTGEVRLRPPTKLLDKVMELRWAVQPGTTVGHVVLRADATVVAAVRVDEENCIKAPCFAFDEWRAAQAPAQ